MRSFPIIALVSCAFACGPAFVDRPTQVVYDPSSTDFWSKPLPSDERMQGDGSWDLDRWPETKDSDLVKMWFAAAKKRLRGGWGVSSGVFAKLSGPIDLSSLPGTPQASIDPSASAFLIDIDPASPSRGQRMPMRFSIPPSDRFTPENLLAAIPVFGYVRRPATKYALVITTDVRDQSGTPIGRSPAFHDGFRTEFFDDLRDTLEDEGFDLSRVAGAAVFTTIDHNKPLLDLISWADKNFVPALTEGWTMAEDYASYRVYTSHYEVPVIQKGDRPYTRQGDGLIARDPATGEPVILERQHVRLALTIPKVAAPAAGFPLTIYMHGSGGEWYQAINRGPVPEVPEDMQGEPVPGTGPAEWLARKGVATIGFDFPLHGDRSSPSDETGLYLYNLLGNIDATFDNFSVAVMELTLLSKLVLTLEVDTPEGRATIDPARLTGMGQSMGTTLGVTWAGVDPRVKGVLFSGAGGILVEIAVAAVEPIRLKGLVELAIHIDEGKEIHVAHPLLHAMQNLWDLVDPIAKAPYVARSPHPGFEPKQVMMTAGIIDGYFDPHAEAAMAAALGVSLAGESIDPTIAETLAIDGRAPIGFPVANNMNGVTAAVLEFAAPHTLGHYVVFNQEGARHQYTCFLASVGTPSGARIPEAAGLDDPCP